MRRAVFLPLALAALAACSDSATGPAAMAPPSAPRASAASAGAIFVSEPQVVAWNEGGLRYGQNLPLADLGGGRIVWQDASSGSAVVLAYDVATGARAQYGSVPGNFAYPVTSGRYTLWSSQQGTMYLRDDATGQVRDIGPGGGEHVTPDGRVAFIQYIDGVGNVLVYDAATGQTRVLTHYTSASPIAASSVDVDGSVVAWSIYTRQSPYTTGIRMMDLATGVERTVVDVPQQYIGAPSVSQGRIVWDDGRSGNLDVYLYDVASGTERQITTNPAGQFNARISGSYIVWEDGRNSTSPYFPSNDIYLYDLRSGMEIPAATGENHQAWPAMDGDRIMWTERANDRWEIRTAVVRALTIEALGSTVDAMLASGGITSRGAAESLRAFLAQAAGARDAGDTAAERDALQRFAAQAQRLSGTQLTAAAADRLASLAATLIATL